MIYDDKSILITGGSGSLSSGLIKEFLKNPIKKLKIYSRDEYKQSKLKETIDDDRMRYYIGDVRDYERLYRAMDGVDYVIHTAALKRIEVCEYDPIEAVKTNINGSINVINCALDRNVFKVLNISTDKAVNPVSMYGNTKACAERLFIDGNHYSKGVTQFINIRLGNLSNSTGSLFPKIKECFDNLDSICLTALESTRFSLTIEKAASLCFKALAYGTEGEIYCSKSKSYSIEQIYEIMKKFLNKKFEIRFNMINQMRPHEKLHEEMLTINDNVVEYDDHYIIIPQFKWYNNKHNQKVININYNSAINEFMTEDEIIKEIGI